MNFASDNWAGAHPKIAEALVAAARGVAPAYGNSDLDRQVGERFSEIFEREVEVFFVGTGTAANALALACATRPGGVAFAHSGAHVIEDECGAPEFLSGGLRLHAVDGALGRIDPAALGTAIAPFVAGNVHAGRAAAVTITQATEAGTVYGCDAIADIADIAHSHATPLHMDGARFANALVRLDCSPAEMTWKAGVDMLSFGGTKNGCWCAEALVLFDPAHAENAAYLRKRSAQLFSKSRFIAAQFAAYLEGDLWLDLARHANAMSQRLAAAIAAAPHVRLAWEPEANEVFAFIPAAEAERLKAAGASFYPWKTPHGVTHDDGDEALYRFVTSFATDPQDVDGFADRLNP